MAHQLEEQIQIADGHSLYISQKTHKAPVNQSELQSTMNTLVSSRLYPLLCKKYVVVLSFSNIY